MGYSLNSTDNACYSGTTVLINKFNIRNEQQLAENESLITSVKSVPILRSPLKDNFDFNDYRHIHKILFEDLYDWAGELRTISLSKSATQFAPPESLEKLGNAIFDRLKNMNYFKNLKRSQFIYETADLYNSLNMLHPFREGNGRTQRIFFMQLIRSAGYDIDYSELNHEFLMIATIQAAAGVMDNLIKFFDININ